MSASAISMQDFRHSLIEVLHKRVPRNIHPMAQQIIHHDFDEMHAAIDDAERVMQLIAKVRARIVQELHWLAETRETFHDFKGAYRLRCQAGRFDV
jgi:inhibitor of KinA sporulation pathway (predicted exonuclease)